MPNPTTPQQNLLILITLVVCVLLPVVSSNFILSVSSTSYQVNDPASLTINIRTSTTITTLDVILSNVFVVASPACRVNGVAVSCNRIVPATGALVYVRFSYSFAASTNYTLFFNITNPSYSDSFSIQANNGATAFGNTGSLTINPKTITCSMASSSPVVSLTANATFLLSVSTMSSGTMGKLSISVNSQTAFPNVINTSPVCSVDGSSVACTLGQVFGVQILSISDVNVGIRPNGNQLNLFVNSVKNSPFNATFESITISVKDSMDRDIEKCIFPQPASTVLQESSSFALQGWGSLVGQVSNAQFLLTPFYAPLADIEIILVYELSLTITPRAPAVFTLTSSATQNFLKITNATYSSQILSFNASIQNPSAVIPLSMVSYILYNDTHFRQQRALPSGSLTLLKQTVGVGVTANNAVTLVSTVINMTLSTPIRVVNGFILNAVVGFGRFICANLGLASSIANISLLNCTSSRLILKTTTPISASSSFWVCGNYLTHISTAPNTLTVQISSVDNFPIMNGSSLLAINPSQPSFTVTSSNSTYTALSNYTFIEANVTVLGGQTTRTVVFVPPLYVKIGDRTTVVTSNAAASTVGSYSIDLAGNTVTAVITGKIEVVLTNLVNPGHYLGGRQWNITCKDTTNHPSSTSTPIQTPQYSPARSTISVSLTNTTIQQLTNITLTFEPLLQYNLSAPPTIYASFSNSSINSVPISACPSCTLLTGSKFSMVYYAVIMRPTIEIYNNKDPNNNFVSFYIAIGDFVYETGSIGYQLDPIQFSFVSTFTGEYANLGTLQIRITSTLSTLLQLNYTGTSSIFTSVPQCQQCNSTYLLLTGIVGYFQATDITVEGYSNSTLYARGTVRVRYPCASISGCQICETVNSTLECTRCFNSILSNYYLLFEGTCYGVCPAETYENGATCSPCPHLCYRCTAATCLECVTNYYIYMESCVLECPPLYIKNSTHCMPRPVVCPTNCIDCPQDNLCNRCDAGYYLLDNLCYTTCPTNYIPNESQAICQLFVPPQETSYFPFAFFIASMLVLVLLRIVKCFQRRSLITSNLLPFVSVFQIGAMVMLMSYTFISISVEPKRWTNNNRLLMQALIFVIILTKIILNVIFLVYFLRRIAHEQNFVAWLDKSVYNYRLYIVTMVLSTVFSFQIVRILYGRLLGLELFFGRFNTALIFKPLNFFSLAYIVPGGGLIVMAVSDIIMQDGYKTSIFYSSIEVILIQLVILASCIIQACRNDKQYFDYQIYKVQNQSEHVGEHSGSKVKIMEQEEAGGSFHQMLLKPDGSRNPGPVGYDAEEVGMQTAGKIIRNKRWREKKVKGVEERGKNGQQIVEDPDDIIDGVGQTNSQGMLKLSSMLDLKSSQRKDRSIFRKKILQDWQELKKKLPDSGVHKIMKKGSTALMSKSPNHKKNKSKLKKITSLEKLQIVEIKTPIPSFKNKKQLKNHFYKIRGSQLVEPQKKNMQNNDPLHLKQSIQLSEAKTYSQDKINQNAILNDGYQNENDNTELGKQDGDLSQIPNNNENQQSFERSLLELRKDIKMNRYEDFENETIQEDEEQKEQQSKAREAGKASQDFGAGKKKMKKRNVNKQTEAVYLQRLVSSSQMQRPKALRRQKLQDF